MYKYNFETFKLNESQIDSVQTYAEYHANAEYWKRNSEAGGNVFLKVLEADLLGIVVTDTERKIYNNMYGEFN
jgi:hypothetical protein